ncbi:19806_t:CDS:2 [Entrophospora sp. SA101]|nr:14672_t:CDS:2 [Entrophospora sp. SA101]CAJ0747280.1 19806_t:CDS:2 [Entrophospora sp. SA101]CAJ0832373.1 10188_t:CDS:2 [Entrophospora sp. SA101]CAJ0890631.1 2742_t:CDS:2 [Entrophospora sp. SA101]
MIAVGKESEIVQKAEVVMPSAIPVRNVANYIAANPNNRSHVDAILFGSESFIPYWQQVHVKDSTHVYADINEKDLLEFCEFLFPSNLATNNNQLISLQTGQIAGTANDYRLTSGANNYDLHSKDYKNLTLFPLYETSTTEVKKFNKTHDLDKVEDANDADADKSSALYALAHNYPLSKDKLIDGTNLIPQSEPNSEEYLKKKAELDAKKLELDEVQAKYDVDLSDHNANNQRIKELEKELGKYTKKDKNALHAKLKRVQNQIEATYDATNQK